MFAVRGIAVSLSAFVLVYCSASIAVSLWWWRFWRVSQKYPVRLMADLLFGLRILPVLAAVAVTFAFTVPSFLLLEPRSIDEPIGIALGLAICGISFAGFGLVNAGLALRRASRKIAEWLCEAKVVESSGGVPVLRISAVRRGRNFAAQGIDLRLGGICAERERAANRAAA
jgi:hypothetical protein